MRRFLISIICVSFALAANAERPIGNKAPQDPELQNKVYMPSEDHVFAAGDTVVISNQTVQYLSGQKVAGWVYQAPHVVGKVGGKAYPEGVLIGNIMSWVDPAGLRLLEPDKKAPARAGQAKAPVTASTSIVRVDTVRQTNTISRMDTVYIHDTIYIGEQAQHVDTFYVREQELRVDTVLRLDTILRVDTVYIEPEYMAALRATGLHRFGIGLRGGVASLMQRTEGDVLGRGGVGFGAMLDLEYAYYASVDRERNTWLGIKTGVSLGYARSSMAAPLNINYDNVPDGDAVAPQNVNYMIRGREIRESDGQLQVEVPVMFALKHASGFFLNLGPKVLFPVYSHYKTSVSDNSRIDVNYPAFGYNVWNEVITGKFTDDNRLAKGNFRNAVVHVLVGLETGAEFRLPKQNSLALGLYGNYSVWNNYQPQTASVNMIEISQPAATGATVALHSAMDTYGKKLGYWDAGLKLTFYLNFWK